MFRKMCSSKLSHRKAFVMRLQKLEERRRIEHPNETGLNDYHDARSGESSTRSFLKILFNVLIAKGLKDSVIFYGNLLSSLRIAVVILLHV